MLQCLRNNNHVVTNFNMKSNIKNVSRYLHISTPVEILEISTPDFHEFNLEMWVYTQYKQSTLKIWG